jgi:hypothetical protein
MAANDGDVRPLARLSRNEVVEIAVCVTEPEFQALTRLAHDGPRATVGDVAARLIAQGLQRIEPDI